jgi:hypothetical protein
MRVFFASSSKSAKKKKELRKKRVPRILNMLFTAVILATSATLSSNAAMH